MTELREHIDIAGRLVARYQFISDVLYWYGRHLAAQAQQCGCILESAVAIDDLPIAEIETRYRQAADVLEAHRTQHKDLEEMDSFRDLDLMDWRPAVKARA